MKADNLALDKDLYKAQSSETDVIGLTLHLISGLGKPLDKTLGGCGFGIGLANGTSGEVEGGCSGVLLLVVVVERMILKNIQVYPFHLYVLLMITCVFLVMLLPMPIFSINHH